MAADTVEADDSTVRKAYQKSMQWKHRKKAIVDEIWKDKQHKREVQPAYIWNGPFRNDVQVVGKRWT